MTTKQFNIRIDADLIDKLQQLAEKESKKTGFKITRSDLVNKALREFVNNYK